MNKIFTLILIIGISIGLLIGSSINILINKDYHQTENTKKNQLNQTINKTKNNSQNQEDNNQVTNKESLNENNKEEYIKIIIQNGFTSNKVADILYENELILNKNDFLILLKSLDLSSKLRVGEKTIKKGSSMIEIINIITN
ncbi:hypothetical protein [Tepidibacter mesophilus]|uniref:hypothetical protein n=1 Tax=Tepidibacter mesophilus TaxID=655607 RepID=UPI000C08AF07|nr:hypothetical protein [Tepidibacter mesophilus]